MEKVYIIGVGPGDPELITLKGVKLIKEADIIVYAGSLIPEVILEYAREDASCHNSATLALEEVCDIMIAGARQGSRVVRLHSGDPAIYGAILEQMTILDKMGIDYEIIPGVSSFVAASAALKRELTIPGETQTVILTRLGGRTPVPEKENLRALASHQATMVIFLSSHKAEQVQDELLKRYPAETPTAVAYKVSRPDQKIIKCTLDKLAVKMKENNINQTALIIVEPGLKKPGKSLLYDKNFTHALRRGTSP